jgi:hypothetical protein
MRVEQSCSPVRKYEVGNEADVIRVPYAVSAARLIGDHTVIGTRYIIPENQNMVARPVIYRNAAGFEASYIMDFTL